MTLYRKRPVIVEAFHFEPTLETMEGKFPLPEWLEDKASLSFFSGKLYGLAVDCHGTVVLARPGDWIIKDPGGEIDLVKPEVFAANYEAMDK